MPTYQRLAVAPPITTALVLSFHRVVNRPIYRDERQVITEIFTGKATNGDARLYWHTAVLAYFSLVPLGLLASLVLTAVSEPLALVLLAIPFVGGLYSLAVRTLTSEDRRRFRPSSLYFLHDVVIAVLTTVTVILIDISL